MPLYNPSNGILKTDDLLFAVNEVRVKQNAGFGEFTSIASALSSITTNSITERFVIRVFSGTYIEPLLDFASKPYVSLVGSAIETVVIKPDANNHHIMQLGEYNEISFVWLEDAGTGFSAIASIDGGDYSQLHKITFNNCDTNILVSATTTDTYLYAEYVDFNGSYTYGIKIESSGGFAARCNAENCYNYPTNAATGFHVSGALSHLDLKAGGNEQQGITAGIGVHIIDGSIDVQGVSFEGFSTAIFMPNGATNPIAQFTGCSCKFNTLDISIQHTSGKGNYQGSMESPNISTNATATFGITYLERLLGNKKEVYYDPYNISPVAVTLPTLAAATTTNQSSVSGAISTTYSGTANQNASLNMRVPKDYLSNGRFKLLYSPSSTSANTIVWNTILSLKSLGNSMAAQTENMGNKIVAAGTANVLSETTYYTPSTPLISGQLMILRVGRLATDASDTYTSSAFINGVVFEYDSSK